MEKRLTILTGDSRGMGLSMAQELLQPGAILLCISRGNNEALAEQAKALGADLQQWQADLSDATVVAARMSDWLRFQDPATLASATLINNAGVISELTALRDAEESGLTNALRVGLEAPMLLCAAFLDATRSWDIVPRKILNVSSGLGRRPMASSSAYCAAKAGMDHFTRCLALEEALLPHGAKVCSLAPGVIDTDMQLQLRSAKSEAFPDQGAFAGLKDNGQLTSPVDAAKRLLAYLARPDFGTQPVADVRE